ncbi:methyltransferase domain-containing protein [Ferrimonas lipolytica]|uniref:Methyltransferase domain-containing protein n=1 Tax=Ferrimonas lipolytica TaxID=2724191 RepID=A0A6H1UAF5_9GAMM|nr:methyltransferase domain-containing protein [Ferrimonas lipolytica]QIZ76031.1 methyltransferase domain-containing protein [Ferrimonas lipolytica]
MTAANCFALAAANYDQHAAVQRWAGDLLLQRCQPQMRWLDIGCGTGYLSQHLSAEQIIGIDIAKAMLQQCQPARAQLLQADMHSLPIATAAVDAIAANLSLQWSSDLQLALTEAARVTAVGGQLLVSVPADYTFTELQPLIDSQKLACNRFLSAAQLQQVAEQAGWRDVTVTSHTTTLYFGSPKALLQHFKLTGAQHAKRQPGLRGRGWWQQICQQLQTNNTERGLPLTWQIHLLEGKR